MGILDEAIREHLELKRQHGADDSELRQLEDDAFGQAERPDDEAAADSLAGEAPTEFLEQAEEGAEPTSRRESSIADLQEPPPPPDTRPAEAEPAAEQPADEPAPVEEQPAMEHEIVSESPAPAEREEEPEPSASGPTTEERHAIAEQPTELHDIEDELASESSSPSPTDEELVEEEIAEPRLAPADPLAGLDEDEEAEVSVSGPAADDDEDYEDEDDAFWNEQRLSDELDQALEAPSAEPEAEVAEGTDVAEDGELEYDAEEEAAPEAEYDEPEPSVSGSDEDVLEETPDFLEEAPEDDQLWFEQKPPKDFDFDD